MKRQLIAIALGGLLALPALADRGPNYELYANGFPPAAQPAAKSRAEVRAELIAAQRAGNFIVNAELGQTARDMYPERYAESTRGHLRAGAGGDAK